MQRVRIGCWVPLCPKEPALVCTWEDEVSINLLDGFKGKRRFVQRNKSLTKKRVVPHEPWAAVVLWQKPGSEAGPSRGGSWVLAGWELCCPWDIAAPGSVAVAAGISKAGCVPGWRGSVWWTQFVSTQDTKCLYCCIACVRGVAAQPGRTAPGFRNQPSFHLSP